MKTITARSLWAWLREYWLNLRRIRFWLAAAALAVAILYMLVGFLVLPWVATNFAVNMVADDLGRDLRIGNVRTNPVTLTLEVEDLALDDVDGQELFGCERLFVDMAWSSLLEWTAVISTARLEGARVHEEQFDSGVTRFTRLLSEFQRRPLPEAGPEGGGIRPEQTGPTLPIALEDVDFSLDNFILADDATAPFQVSGRFELGGKFAFDGEVQVLPSLDLAGTLDVDDLALELAEPFVQRYAHVRTDSGSLSAEGELRSGPGDPLTYAGSARIDALDIRERDGGKDVVAWQALTIDGIDFRLKERLLELSVVRMDQPSARVFIAEDRSTNLGKLLIERPAVPEEKVEPFDIVIGDARLNGGVLAVTDRSLPLPPGIRVRELSGGISGFSPGQEEPAPFQASGRFERGGKFAFDGEVQTLPGLDLAGTLDVDDLALALAEPFVQRYAHVRIDSGSLSAEGKLRSGPGDPLTYAGSARIDALDIGERDGGEDVLGWQALTIDEIDFRLKERLLELSVIRMDQPSARVFIAEDRSTNLGKLLIERPAAPEEKVEPFDIVIGGVRLDGGDLAFTDRSLPLPFATRVHKLRGGISQFSPGLEEPARVDLEGQVADYGQARINGEVNPWSPLHRTRFELLFENLDIPDLTPYAVQFTGRRIAAGRMDLDLGYVLEDGHLDARNNIVLRDLKLGERFEHPDATNLPLSLAIALLKDSDGVIRVDIPVQGSVNDPDFSFGPAIRQAFMDMLQGIITSPFDLLANLVNGDPDELAKVAFAPGSSDVPPPQREGLDQLRNALDKRPELALKVPAPYAPDADRPALQRQRARAAMVERLDQTGINVANPSLTGAETSETLEVMFINRYPQRDLSDVRERFTTKAEDEESAFDAAAYREHLANEVTAAQTVTEQDLEALAQARADAVRNFILGQGDAPAIEPDRVRAVAPIEVEPNGAILLEVGLAAD